MTSQELREKLSEVREKLRDGRVEEARTVLDIAVDDYTTTREKETKKRVEDRLAKVKTKIKT